MGTTLRIALGIATVDRASLLERTLAEIGCQTRHPDVVVVCSPLSADLEAARAALPDVEVIPAARGLTRQRNAIIEHIAGRADILVFLDDDFIASAGYLAAIERAFRADPRIVVGTGTVLADGILGPGLDFDTGRRLAHDAANPRRAVSDIYNAYGCNMAVRLLPVLRHGIRFDEQLPLYGWLEDVDFSRQLAPHGRIVRVPAASGVHLGTKNGRIAGFKLGYSQIANPIYLTRKGTYARARAVRLITRNLAANLVRQWNPEPYVDRRGRVLGNLRALSDLIRGRLAPDRVSAFYGARE